MVDGTVGGAVHGADVEALRASALAMIEAADLLELVDLRTVDGLAALTWAGRDAQGFRERWDSEHAVTLHVTACLLRRAAGLLLHEAQDQVDASGGSSAVSGGDGGVNGGTATEPSRWSSLLASVERSADAGAALLKPYTDGLAALDAPMFVMELAGLRTRATQALDLAAGHGLGAIQDFSIGAGTAAALDVIGGVGAVVDGYSAYQGFRDGDLWQGWNGTVSSALGAAGVLGGGTMAGGAGIAWTVGGLAGEQLNDAMQGTDFHARFTERMEPAFELGGVAGVLNTPGALLVTGAESVGIAAAEAWDDGVELWHQVTGSAGEPEDP